MNLVGFEADGPAPDPPEGPDPRLRKGGYEVVTPVRRGRPRKAYDQGRLDEVVRLYFVEKMSMRQVAEVVGVSHMSVYRILSDPTLEILI